MYRRGPSKAAPANVQCQKCLKRGHYSYECKASTQERPYVPRPSRTQQLLNPKLVPKLTSETPDALQKKKGVADEELAKREAERARKRELERDEDESGDDGPPRHRRPGSRSSLSSASTRASRSPGFPGRDREFSRSPRAAGRAYESPPPATRSPPRRDPYSSEEGGPRGSDDMYRPRSISPLGRRSERSISPAKDISHAQDRYHAHSRAPDDDGPAYNRRRRYSSSPSRSPPPDNQRRFRSRSPGSHRARGGSPPRYGDDATGPERRGGYRGERDASRDRARGAPARREQRERSLSPFSKRLALTRAMNMGR